MPLQIDFSKVGNAIANGLESIGTYSAKAAEKANSISAQAQSAQGAFNQASANQANMLNDQSIASQYGFNSAMMSAANQYNTQAWNEAAAWNEEMWHKQAKFNAEQAQLNRDFNAAEAQKLRDWQTNMANTSYQRAMADMSAAGLNPILAYSQGGANVPGGAAGTGTAATVGGAQMSSASAQMASGGLLGANMASESNFTGQMEQMSSTLALLGAIFSGISSATDAAGGLGDVGEAVMDGVSTMIDQYKEAPNFKKSIKENWKDYKEEVEKNGGWWETLKETATMTPAKEKALIKGQSNRDQYLRQNAINKSWEKYWKPKG